MNVAVGLPRKSEKPREWIPQQSQQSYSAEAALRGQPSPWSQRFVRVNHQFAWSGSCV